MFQFSVVLSPTWLARSGRASPWHQKWIFWHCLIAPHHPDPIITHYHILTPLGLLTPPEGKQLSQSLIDVQVLQWVNVHSVRHNYKDVKGQERQRRWIVFWSSDTNGLVWSLLSTCSTFMWCSIAHFLVLVTNRRNCPFGLPCIVTPAALYQHDMLVCGVLLFLLC